MMLGGYALGAPVPLGAIGDGDHGTSATIDVYLASHDYVSRIGDAAPNRYYAGVITRGRVRRSGQGGRGIGGARAFTTGELELANGDGRLDNWFLHGGVDGRSITIKRLARNAPPGGESLDDAETLFVGVMTRSTLDLDRVRLEFRCRGALLEKPLQAAKFAGTGGTDGGEDVKDQPLPVALGRAYGVTPVYLGTIGGKHSYMVSGGEFLPIDGVPAFYDRGVALAEVTGTPSSGEYAVDTATGIVTIGGTAPELPTCDVRGWAPNGALLQTTADIWQALVSTIGGETSIDAASVDDMNSDQPAPVGLWVGTEERKLGAVLDQLLAGVTALAGCDRAGRHHVGQLKAPGGVIRAIFDQSNIDGLERVAGGAVTDPSPWRIVVEWRPNYTPTQDVAASASTAQRQFMAEAVRRAAVEDLDHQVERPLAGVHEVAGLFADEADATAEASRLQALFRGRSLWRVKGGRAPASLDYGDTVEVNLPRFGFHKQLATVVDWEVDFRTGRLTPVVFM